MQNMLITKKMLPSLENHVGLVENHQHYLAKKSPRHQTDSAHAQLISFQMYTNRHDNSQEKQLFIYKSIV